LAPFHLGGAIAFFRDSGSRPFAVEMSLLWRRIAPRQRRAGDRREPSPAADGGADLDVLEPAPRVEIRGRVDRPVVAEEEQVDRVDLEVHVRRRSVGVAGGADEAEHVACLDAPPVHRQRREGGEVRVVELVALVVAQPEAVAADVVPADGEDGPVGDRQEGGPERREDVVPVVVRDVGAGRAERVAVRRRAVDGEDVAPGRQLGRQARRRDPER
jgi:hypothetical protein